MKSAFLLGCYPAYSDNYLPMFSEQDQSQKSVRNYHYILVNIREESGSQDTRRFSVCGNDGVCVLGGATVTGLLIIRNMTTSWNGGFV
jgi:hypothetical protein